MFISKRIKLGLALTLLGGTFLFSHSAYASDISISNSGKVSFGKVQPSSVGALVTGEDSLSISTTCAEGVNIYATSVNGNDTGTSLVNLAAKAQDTEGTNAASYTINTSSATIGSATALTDNTWGLNTNASEAGNGLYYGLPAFSDSTTPTAIYTGTDSSIPVYFGAKVTNALATGTYNGQVLYTATVNTACLNYTVTFDKNAESATGSMESQTILPAGGSLRANSFKYSGYTFLGWSTSPEGKTGTAANGIGTEADVEYGNTAIFPDSTISPNIEPGDDVTLYAIWKKDIVYMQNWLGCAKMNANETTTLVDNRDNHEYKVKKLPDGKCWMIQNLTLAADDMVTEGKALTSADTNIDNNTTYYLPKAGYQGSITSSSTPTSTSSTVSFSTSSDNQGRIAFRAKNTTNNNTGNPVPEDTAYYNFYTATLGYAYYGSGSSGSSTRDICPKGWGLPKTTDSGTNVTTVGTANDFTNLARTYNSSASWSGSTTGTSGYSYSTSDATIRQNMIKGDSTSLDPELDINGAAGFTYAGSYGSTTLNYVGTYGYYWSSSVYNSNYGYLLYFSTSYVRPQYNGNKSSGYAVRCVAQYSDVSGYMQDFDASTLTNVGQIAKLLDERDNHIYKVKKLPDGKVWMINNLTLTATDLVTEGKALTNANTNIPSSDTNSYYITPKNARYTSTGSFNNSAVASASASVNFSTSYPNYIQIGYRDKNTTNNNTGNPVPEDTAYYNFYTATLGYSYYNDGKTSGSSAMDICPKGWRLPKTTDSGTNVTTVGTANDFTNLARTYNSSASWSGSATGTSGYGYYTSDSTIRQNMIKGDASSLDPELDTNGSAGFTYAGNYNSTTLYDVGTYGYYWSSSVYNSNYGYLLYFGTSYVYPQFDNYYKYRGFAVRCVAQ